MVPFHLHFYSVLPIKTWLHPGCGNPPSPNLAAFDSPTSTNGREIITGEVWLIQDIHKHCGCAVQEGASAQEEDTKLGLEVRGSPFSLTPHELLVRAEIVGNRSSRGSPGPLAPTATHPRSPGWRSILEKEDGSRSERIWRVLSAHRWLARQCPLLSADGFQCLLAIEAWRRQEEGGTVHHRHHCAPHGAQAVVQGTGQDQAQLLCSLEMETGGWVYHAAGPPSQQGEPGKLCHSSHAAYRNLTRAHPNLTFEGIFRRWPIRMELFTMLWWERVAPLGFPVVP